VLLVAVAWSFSDSKAICYVLLILWTTSCFHIVEQMRQNQRPHVCFVEFAGWRHQGEVCCLRLHLFYSFCFHGWCVIWNSISIALLHVNFDHISVHTIYFSCLFSYYPRRLCSRQRRVGHLVVSVCLSAF